MRDRIIQKWVDKILENYPIKPVIEIVQYVNDAASKIVDNVLDLLNGKSNEIIGDPIDDLMRFLATDRSRSPGESIKLIIDLKFIIANELNLEIGDRMRLYEILDKFAFKAFDYYMQSREKIFELRLKEKERELEIMRKIIEFAEKAKF